MRASPNTKLCLQSLYLSLCLPRTKPFLQTFCDSHFLHDKTSCLKCLSKCYGLKYKCFTCRLKKQKQDLESALKNPESDEFMQAFLYPTTSQAKLASLNSKISSKETQIADIKSENVKLIASIANTTGGDIAINAGENVEIKAGTDEKTSHFYHKTSDFFSSDTIQKDKQTSQTISALIAGNNVNIHSDNDTTILASVITGGGDGDINAGGSLSVEFALNQYYAMDYEMKTSMDVGAIVVGAVVAVAVTVATGGAGLALAGVAIGGAMTGSKAQNGSEDTKKTNAQIVVGSSILFNKDLSLTAKNAVNIESSNIKANEDLNITTQEFNLTAKEDSVLLTQEHTDISTKLY